ncbi:unnamed protein product [Prunus armeniaca]
MSYALSVFPSTSAHSLHTAFARLHIAGQLQTPHSPGPTYTTHSLHDPSWYSDTSASIHMIGNLSLLQQCLPNNGHDTVHHGNGDQMLISYMGNMSLSIGTNYVQLNNVYVIPFMRPIFKVMVAKNMITRHFEHPAPLMEFIIAFLALILLNIMTLLNPSTVTLLTCLALFFSRVRFLLVIGLMSSPLLFFSSVVFLHMFFTGLLLILKCLPHPSEWVVVPVSPSVPPHATLPNPTLPSATEASSSPHACTFRPRVHTNGTIRYPIPSALLSRASLTLKGPTCFSQVVHFPEWREAMVIEFNALLKNQTSVLIPLSQQHVVGCKWVFKLKRKSDGSIEKYKARLIAKGFHQQPGIDFDETFSHVVKPTTVRTILALAVSFGWPLRQLDVKNAFLHGYLETTVFMSQPPRLLVLGFSDIVAFYSNLENQPFLISSFVLTLGQEFELTDMGPFSYFLGIEATSTIFGLLLSQTKYIVDLLKRHSMTDCKHCSTLICASRQLSSLASELLSDAIEYRQLVGSLQYLTFTKPDMSFDVHHIVQFMSAPRSPHLVAAKRILHYLNSTLGFSLSFSRSPKSTLGFGLSFRRSPSPITFHGFSGSDWAGCPDTHRSTTGFCVFVGSNLISWCAKKQSTVSYSSAEAEYRSLAHVCADTTWISHLLHELALPSYVPTLLLCDNLGTIYMASNSVFHAHTKHIELNYHFIWERIISGSHQVQFVSSYDQLADILTKGLSTHHFQLLRSNLVSSTSLDLGGSVRQHP